MIPPEIVLTILALTVPPESQNDPLKNTVDFHTNVRLYVDEIEEQEELEAERALEAEQEAARSSERSVPSGSLPELLAFIRSNESGGNYSAYNASGCEGYGCGGAYQMHALYASVWAERAGYPGLSGNAATWAPAVQDAVALELFYSTNPDGAHWCNWTDYC